MTKNDQACDSLPPRSAASSSDRPRHRDALHLISNLLISEPTHFIRMIRCFAAPNLVTGSLAFGHAFGMLDKASIAHFE